VQPKSLTDVERLQLVNQYKILEKLDPENEKHYAELRKILEKGITIFYEKVFEDIIREISPAKCHFVEDVVHMFWALQYGFKKLQDKSGLEAQNVLFLGFAVRDEDEWRFAEYWRGTGALWQKTLKMDMDPYSPGVPTGRYTKMLERWNVIKTKYEGKEKWKLTKEEIRAIISDDDTE